MKQNFRYISSQLPEWRNDPLVQQLWTDADWHLLAEVRDWMTAESPGHRPVVLWVRRSCPAFEKVSSICLLGRYEFYRDQVLGALEQRGLPCSVDGLAQVLPPADRQFDVRLVQPLPMMAVERVEERIGDETTSRSTPA